MERRPADQRGLIPARTENDGQEAWDRIATKDRAYHRAVAGDYDATVATTYSIYHQLALEPMLDELEARYGIDLTALDIGCGTGAVAIRLAQRGFEVHGIDHSPEMLALAQQHTERLGLNVEFRTGDVRKLPFADESIDFLTCQGVLHHLPFWRPVIAEVARVLRPGGSFYLSEPCLSSTPPSRFWNRAVTVAARVRRATRRVAAQRALGPADHEGPLDPEDLLPLLDELGLVYQVEYSAHLELLERFLSDRARLQLTRLISAPWRRTRGDIMLITGSKPSSPAGFK
ncbi:MAG: class I SAM-dependent methyltransferase [Actinomycetota bacterium]